MSEQISRKDGQFNNAQRDKKSSSPTAGGREIFWTAVAILALLLVLSIIVLSVRLAQYAYLDDREVALNSKIHQDKIDIFDIVYKNESGEITVSGADDQKVIAPGTDVEYTIRIRNVDTVAIDFELLSGIEVLSDHKLPILVRMLDPNDEYIVGDEKTWVGIDELASASHRWTLASGDAVEYTFQWKWPYDSGDDLYDTFIGNIDADVGVKVSLTVNASANTDIDANGGFIASGFARTLVSLIFAILLLVSIILLVIYSLISKARGGAPTPAPEPPAEPSVTDEPEEEIADAIVEPAPEPKPRQQGFNGKMAYINIDVLNENFASGDVITLSCLKERGLLPQEAKQMKVLARNGYKLDKAFIIETQGISAEARRIVADAGGVIIITKG